MNYNLIFLEIICAYLVMCYCATGFSKKLKINGNHRATQEMVEEQNLFRARSVLLRTNLTDWSPWNRCDRRCIKSRTRYCLDPVVCIKKVIKQTRRCNRRCLMKPRKTRKDKAKHMEETVYELLYGDWSVWSPCTRSCKKRRYRTCVNRRVCKGTVLMEHRACYIQGSKRCKKARVPDSEDDDARGGRRRHDQKPKKTEDHNYETEIEADSSITNQTNIFSNPEGGHIFEGCGIRNVTARTRIIGGQESRHGSWPWQVAIMTQWKEQYCGGVMITKQWVLTAAHCLRRRMRRVILRIGEHDFAVEQGTEQDFKINRHSAILHPNFNMEDIDSDIALVKLKEPIKDEDSIGYACIPQEEDILHDNTMCYVVGWGKTRETHLFGTDVLREARVPLVSRTKCQDAFDFQITQNQMCAGVRQGGMDTCAGDSGGPLMCQINKNGVKRWYVYGVTSFGEGCGDKGKYGIYTVVRNFHKWIQKIVFT